MSTAPDQTVADVALGWRVLDAVISIKERLGLRSGRLGHWLLVLPGLLVVSILTVGIVLLAWRSFHVFDPYLYRQGGLSTANYRNVIQSHLVRQVFVRTVVMALITTAIAVTVAVPASYIMTRAQSRVMRLALLVAIFVPILTGDIVRAYGWLVLLGREGLATWVIERVGLGSPVILGTLPAVGIGSVQILIPLSVMIMLPSFYRVDTQLEQAAATLGAGRIRVWVEVVLPLVRPGIAGATALSMTVAMTEFATPQLLGLGVRSYAANLVQSIVLGRDNVYLGAAMGLSLLATTMILVFAVLIIARGTRGGSRKRAAKGGAR